MQAHPRRWLILIVLCLSTLVLVIDNMALAVAVPSLAADLGATSQDIQWILESYMLVFAYDAAMSTAFLGGAAGVIGAAVLALLLLRGRKVGAHAAREPQTLVNA